MYINNQNQLNRFVTKDIIKFKYGDFRAIKTLIDK